MADELKAQVTEQKGNEQKANVFTQEDVNNLIAKTRKETLEKFSDYEDLRKFKTEHEKSLEAQTQAELEKQKEYEKLKEGWTSKEREYQNKLNEATSQLTNERINNSLVNEVMKQNAFPEAAKLIRDNVVYADGKITIKGRNEQGIETDLSIEEGVKQFLKERPYLVKANTGGGAGTGAGSETGGVANPNTSLGEQLLQARKSGDSKRAMEIKAQMRAKLNSGVLI